MWSLLIGRLRRRVGCDVGRPVWPATEEPADLLQELLPDRKLNDWFLQIVQEGTGKQFQPEHNRRWTELTRPMLEAFFHARFFLEMVCKYGRELDSPPQTLPSGWAAVLYLYGLR